MKTYGDSITGMIRKKNEDCVLIHDCYAPYFVLVADGMGGAAAGEVASILTAKYMEKYILDSGEKKINKELLQKAVDYTNNEIIDQINKNKAFKGMGSTLTFATFTEKEVLLAQVGDSAAYAFSKGELKKITKDHSYMQKLIDSGMLTDDQAKTFPYRNIITRAMGMEGVKADYYCESWSKGDLFFLCSDGMTNNTEISIICDILNENVSLKHKVDRLLKYALECGGSDNISVILVENTGCFLSGDN